MKQSPKKRTILDDPADKHYGVTYVAEMFSVTTETVRAWIKAGKLPAVQINGYYKVGRNDLIAFANRKYGPQERTA